MPIYSYIGKEYDTELINVSLFEIVSTAVVLLLCLPVCYYNASPSCCCLAWDSLLRASIKFRPLVPFALAARAEINSTRWLPKTLAPTLYMCIVLRIYTYTACIYIYRTCRRYFSINECLYAAAAANKITIRYAVICCRALDNFLKYKISLYMDSFQPEWNQEKRGQALLVQKLRTGLRKGV